MSKGYDPDAIQAKLADLRTADEPEKCADLNYMVFNYGKFHNNLVNQIIHIIFVPMIVYTWIVQACYITSYQLPAEIPLLGDTVAFGIVPSLILCTAYMFVDWKVGLGVLCWWGPCAIFG